MKSVVRSTDTDDLNIESCSFEMDFSAVSAIVQFETSVISETNLMARKSVLPEAQADIMTVKASLHQFVTLRTRRIG